MHKCQAIIQLALLHIPITRQKLAASWSEAALCLYTVHTYNTNYICVVGSK